MKRVLLAALLAVAVPGLMPAMAGADGHKADPVAKALMRIEADLLAALVRGDAEAFERQLAENFSMIGPDGKVQTRAELLADLRSGALKVASSANDDMKVRAYPAAAVVTYRNFDKRTYKGTESSGQYRRTDVFVKKGARWLIVASQGTRVPEN